MLDANVADGVHRIEDAYTNWYLIEHDRRLTIVDTGLPTSWSSLLSALRSLGRGTGDVEAVALTHGHFDHLGSRSGRVVCSACRCGSTRMTCR
jgi:glyoxylase-like metal-dependent hydrolase (beta-lactamase superfamily II)